MKILIFIIFFLSSCSENNYIFEQEDLEEIENTLNFPKKVSDLNKYHRYCYIGDEELNCTYINEGKKKFTFLNNIDEMPEILDGGCDIINLKYRFIEKKADHLFCNGEA